MPAASPHVIATDARQAGIYRRMTPEQRLVLGMTLNRQMRELMDSGLKALHPELTPEARSREIARRIRHARS